MDGWRLGCRDGILSRERLTLAGRDRGWEPESAVDVADRDDPHLDVLPARGRKSHGVAVDRGDAREGCRRRHCGNGGGAVTDDPSPTRGGVAAMPPGGVFAIRYSPFAIRALGYPRSRPSTSP